MPKQGIIALLETGKILVSDGAWGTMLQAKGLRSGACPEEWNLSRPSDVADVARAYAQAGADIVETNSFGGSTVKLAHYNLASRAREINRLAATLSREGAGDGALVMGSIGPCGKLLLMEEVEEDELFDAFAEQSAALEEGGADAICIETMSDIEEAAIAIRAARQATKLPVICTFTFDRMATGGFKTMFGVSPQRAAQAATEAGAHITGTNCGNGIEAMVEIVAAMRAAAPGVPLLVQSNAGLPITGPDGICYPESPTDMASHVPALIDAGASIIGGCCGTTPAHIRAIKQALLGR